MVRDLDINAPQLLHGPHVNRRGGVMHAGLNAVAPDLQLRPRATDHFLLLGSLRHSVAVDPPSETKGYLGVGAWRGAQRRR